MIKKIALILAVLMLVSFVFTACANNEKEDDKQDDEKGEEKKGDDEKSDDEKGDDEGKDNDPLVINGVKIQDYSKDQDDYYYNPQLKAAYRVDDKTIRVQFSNYVYAPLGGATNFIYAVAKVFDKDKIPATAFTALDPKVIGNNLPTLYAKTYDIKFDKKIPESCYVCFEETVDTNNDGALDNVLCDDEGTGLYAAYRPEDTSMNPVAARKVTDDIIEAPEADTILMRAYCCDTEKLTFILEFSKPVRCIDDGDLYSEGEWANHVFICDSPNPNPGVGGSWQCNVRRAADIDFVVGSEVYDKKSGALYASKWKMSFTPRGDGEPIPVEAVLRISENCKRKDTEANENGEEDDNLGRIVIAIDGTPLQASVPSSGGFDVAHCRYSSLETAYIAG